METFFNYVRSIVRFKHWNYHLLTAPQLPPCFESLLAEISCLCSCDCRLFSQLKLLRSYASKGNWHELMTHELQLSFLWCKLQTYRANRKTFQVKSIKNNRNDFHTERSQTIEHIENKFENLSNIQMKMITNISLCLANFSCFGSQCLLSGESFVNFIVIVEDAFD